MINVKNIFDKLVEIAPIEQAEEWDNCGLLVGEMSSNVSKVLVTLDVTESVISYAIEMGANLIVSHHPVIFAPIKSVTNQTRSGRQIINLVRNNISVISMHTNFDKAEGGLNTFLAREIGLKNISKADTNEFIRFGDLTTEIDLNTFALAVKDKLGINGIRLITDGKTNPNVKKVAVFSGKSDIQDIIANKNLFDVAVCGDVGYHDALDLLELGINVIDAGHFGTEWLFSKLVSTYLSKNFENIKIIVSNQINPFVQL